MHTSIPWYVCECIYTEANAATKQCSLAKVCLRCWISPFLGGCPTLNPKPQSRDILKVAEKEAYLLGTNRAASLEFRGLRFINGIGMYVCGDLNAWKIQQKSCPCSWGWRVNSLSSSFAQTLRKSTFHAFALQ